MESVSTSSMATTAVDLTDGDAFLALRQDKVERAERKKAGRQSATAVQPVGDN